MRQIRAAMGAALIDSSLLTFAAYEGYLDERRPSPGKALADLEAWIS
jgi:hypothetical protein